MIIIKCAWKVYVLYTNHNKLYINIVGWKFCTNQSDFDSRQTNKIYTHNYFDMNDSSKKGDMMAMWKSVGEKKLYGIGTCLK